MLKHYLLPGLILLAGLPLAAQRSENHYASKPYDNSNVQAQIRLNVDKEKAIHFIRDNTDPYVVTKTYVLKNADVYELRPYLRAIVQSKQITEDNTVTECVKMNDGTGILLVSAEENRFKAQPNGMGIDEIVALLDQPKMTSASGSVRFMYFPMYRNAAELSTMIYNVGMVRANDTYEMEFGVDKVAVDPALNAMLFYVPQFSKKTIQQMLAQYDQPLLQVLVRFVVYELTDENDGKMGMDFQSWKNNDGVDFFSIGGRYRSNWASTWSGGISPQTDSNKTQYMNFNPKWNTKYLELLVSEGHAKVLTSGEIQVKNNETAVIDVNTNLFEDDLTPVSDQTLSQYAKATGTIYSSKPGTAAAGYLGNYYFDAKDSGGTSVLLNGGSITSGSLTAIKITPANNTSDARYQLAVTGGTLTKGGKNVGTSTDNVASFTMYRCTSAMSADNSQLLYSWTEVSMVTDMTVAKGNQVSTNPGPGFGFKMTVKPQVNRNASIMSVNLVNTSLIGWTSTGKPRVDRDSEVNTDVHLSNGGNRFVIGGLEKRELVRSVSGVPFLREIPGLGWVFGSESESTKKSRLVVVGECVLSGVKAPLTDERRKVLQDTRTALDKAGKTNTWGFGQYGLDKDRGVIATGLTPVKSSAPTPAPAPAPAPASTPAPAAKPAK